MSNKYDYEKNESALKEIKKILSGLEEDGPVAAAINGVLELAEENLISSPIQYSEDWKRQVEACENMFIIKEAPVLEIARELDRYPSSGKPIKKLYRSDLETAVVGTSWTADHLDDRGNYCIYEEHTITATYTSPTGVMLVDEILVKEDYDDSETEDEVFHYGPRMYWVELHANDDNGEE